MVIGTASSIWLGVWIGAATILMIAVLWLKIKPLALIPALLWVLIAFDRINAAVLKNFSDFDYQIGWACIAASLFCLSSMIWAFKKPAPEPTAPDTREDWEIEDENREKRMKHLRRFRPKIRGGGNPYDRA